MCEHCEVQAELDELGLCPRCRSMETIRELYERRRDWSPEWEAHLRRLAQRAKARLPLFEQPRKERDG